MSLIRHSPYKSTSSENVGPTVLTQSPDNHNKEIGKNSINYTKHSSEKLPSISVTTY